MLLKDLLEKEKFQYLRVLNSKPDLSRTVFTVESTETPDVAKYIPQNTLLIMTGMAFKEDPTHMCSFLEELDRRSCAAVAIKLGRFIDELDESVLETADQLGIPLLQITMDKTLGSVYQEILSYIWGNQNDHLVMALNAQQKISNLILQGSSMKSIINNVAVILEKSVMLIDLFGRVLEYSYTYTKGLREKTLRVITELMQEKRFNKSTYFVFEEEEICFCVYPVKGVGRNTNYIILLDFNPKEKEEHLLVMEQIIMALELYFYKNLYVKYNEIKLREEFRSLFFEQLEKKVWSERQILAIGDSYGLRPLPEYRVVLVELGRNEQRKFNRTNFSKKEEEYILTYDWMNYLLSAEANILIFPQELKWRYVCLIQGKHEDYLELFIRIHDTIKHIFHIDVTISQGGVVSSVTNAANSFREAEQGMRDGNRDKQYPYILNYRPKSIMELFKFIPEREIRDICEYTLKELAYPKNQMEEELRKTLSTYLLSSNSITQTAEKLFVHRNTIKYRLKKCGEILERDLSDVSDCFQIQLALSLTESAQ